MNSLNTGENHFIVIRTVSSTRDIVKKKCAVLNNGVYGYTYSTAVTIGKYRCVFLVERTFKAGVVRARVVGGDTPVTVECIALSHRHHGHYSVHRTQPVN